MELQYLWAVSSGLLLLWLGWLLSRTGVRARRPDAAALPGARTSSTLGARRIGESGGVARARLGSLLAAGDAAAAPPSGARSHDAPVRSRAAADGRRDGAARAADRRGAERRETTAEAFSTALAEARSGPFGTVGSSGSESASRPAPGPASEAPSAAPAAPRAPLHDPPDSRADSARAGRTADLLEATRLRLASREETVAALRERVAALVETERRLAAREDDLVKWRRIAARLVAAERELAARDADIVRLRGIARRHVATERRLAERDEELSRLRAGRSAQDELWRARVAGLDETLSRADRASAGAARDDLGLRRLRSELESLARERSEFGRRLSDLERRVAERRARHPAWPVKRQPLAPPLPPGPPGPPGPLRPSNPREPLFEPSDERDDLQRIKGIGPVMERLLNELGVTSFAQLAAFTPADIERVAAAIATFPGRIERDDWVGRARECLRREREVDA